MSECINVANIKQSRPIKQHPVVECCQSFPMCPSGIACDVCRFIILGQDPCPCAFDIVDMVPYAISKLSAKSQFCAIQTADNTDGKVRIEIILLLENNKMLPRKIKTETK